MIDVEQHALRAFEQDAPSAQARFIERDPDWPGELEDEVGDLAQIALQSRAIDAGPTEAGAKGIVMGADAIELRAELAEMGKVADADRAAADLVFISGADAASGRADPAGPRRILAQRVEIAVKGKDKRAGIRDLQRFGGDRDPLVGELLDLRLERPRVEDDAVADHRERAADDPGRKQRELVGLLADDQGVARIVAALEANHAIGAAGQPIDDLALALVAPLAADHGNVRHLHTFQGVARRL